MTKEDKELLLKDISARLPYGVKLLHTPTNEITNLEMIGNGVIDGNIHDLIENFKPYLFPLSSMTEEQKKEYEDALVYHDYVEGGWTIAKLPNDEYFIPSWFVDFCNKHHLDYRGLLEKGLAIDATGLNIY